MASTEKNPDTTTPDLDSLINESEKNAGEMLLQGFASATVGAFSGFMAVSDSLHNGSMRGGEVVIATISASGLFAGVVAAKAAFQENGYANHLKSMKAAASLQQ